MGLVLVLAFFIAVAAPTTVRCELKPIVFGAALPLGDYTGRDALRGLTFGVDEINKQGGIRLPDGKHLIKLEVMDSRDLEPGVPVSEALLTVERLILEKKADVMISGPERSEAWLAAKEFSVKFKKIMFANAGCYAPAIHMKIASDLEKYKYCWVVQNDARTDIMRVAPLFNKFKNDWGWKKFFVMVQDVAHTRAAGEAITKVLGKMGWENLGLERYPTGTNDFSLGLLAAKKKGADLLYLSFEMPQLGILMRQWAELKVPALPMGLIAAANPVPFWEETRGGCEYALMNMFLSGNAPSNPFNESVERWYKGFMKRWPGYEPETSITVQPYVTAWVYKDAVERAGTLDPDKVSEALLKTDLECPFGRARFNPKTHQIAITDDPKTGAVTLWSQWQKPGERVAVWPPAAATGKLQLPAWKK
jgi:branched-chain amino acid transport system substrate-binding protein